MDNTQQTSQPQVEQAVQTPMKKSVPAGVKVISVLYYISFAFALIAGIWLLVAGPSLVPFTGIQVPAEATGIGTIVIIIGIVALVISVLLFFIARGLWKGKNWARILVIIFAAIGLIDSIMSLISGAVMNGIINAAVNGLIGGYLLFNNGVKEAFTKSPTPAQ